MKIEMHLIQPPVTSSLRSMRSIRSLSRSGVLAARLMLRCYSSPSSGAGAGAHASPAVTHRLPHDTLTLFYQTIRLSDGSSFTTRCSSPAKPLLQLTKDSRNHPLWNPERRRQLDATSSELRKFQSRFAVELDAVSKSTITSSSSSSDATATTTTTTTTDDGIVSTSTTATSSPTTSPSANTSTMLKTVVDDLDDKYTDNDTDDLNDLLGFQLGAEIEKAALKTSAPVVETAAATSDQLSAKGGKKKK